MRIIQAPVIQVDTFSFVQCGPKTVDISCDAARVIGMAWMRPLTSGGVLKEYQKVLDCYKPSPDSIRVCIVQVNQPESHTYYICVDDDADPSIFTDMCNACCGETPSAPDYTPPLVIIEDCIGCPDANGNHVWSFPMPVNPNGAALKATLSIDGGAYDGLPDTFANPAALLTWLQTNASGSGTWTSAVVGSTTVITFTAVSTAVQCVGMAVTLASTVYCIPVGATHTFDSVKMQVDSTPTYITVPLPGGPVTYGVTTPNAVIYALQRFLNGLFTVVAGPTPQVQYSGLQKPIALMNGTTTVQAISAGACMNVFTFAIPANPSSLHYNISGEMINGSAASPTPPTGTFTTTGAMATWLNANQAAYGTWTISGSNLVLTSPTTYSAALTIAVA